MSFLKLGAGIGAGSHNTALHTANPINKARPLLIPALVERSAIAFTFTFTFT